MLSVWFRTPLPGIAVSQKENDCRQLWSAGTIMWIVHWWEHHPTIHSLHKRVELLVSFCECLVKTVLLRVVRFVPMWHRATASWNKVPGTCHVGGRSYTQSAPFGVHAEFTWGCCGALAVMAPQSWLCCHEHGETAIM